MTITEYAATTARAFMTAEIAMALVNCGDANVTRSSSGASVSRSAVAASATGSSRAH